MTAIDVDREWRLLIGGEWIAPGAGTYEIVDPNSTSVVGYAPEATVGQAKADGESRRIRRSRRSAGSPRS